MTARVLTLLERHGEKVDALELPVAELRNPEARIDIETVDRLIEIAASMLGAAGLGLKLAAIVDVDTYDAAGRVMLAGRTLRECFELGFKHQRLWGDTNRFSMRADAHVLRIAFKHPGKSALAKAVLAELALAEVVRAARVLARREAVAIGVRFAHRALGDTKALQAIFGCDVTFGAAKTELLLSAELADSPLQIPRELLRRALEHDAVLAQAELPRIVQIVDRARAASRDLPSLTELAGRLMVSRRTLQRKLSEEGSSYFELIDAIRREMVVRLTAQGLSEKTIAFEVGFGDDRALARARARWG
jgi:AraC-like DNA-binding protein